MSLRIAQFDQDDPRFARCFELRLEVFVQEQNVPVEEERDAHDATALHFLATENDVGLGTARVLRDAGIVRITRVAVARSARGRGIGSALMRYIENCVPTTEYRLDAQVHAMRFYENLGYRADGEAFMEVGIPHCHMRKVMG